MSMSVDRLLLMAVLASFVVSRWRAGGFHSRLNAVDVVTLSFLGVVCVSTFMNDWHAVRPGIPPIVPRLINGFIIPCMLYAMGRYTNPDERSYRWFYFAFAGFGVYLAVTAFCEIAGAWSYVFPRYISDSSLGIHFGRARGPFLQSVRLGIYLTAGLAAVWVPLIWQRNRGRPGLLLGLVFSCLIIAAHYVTYTRSVWLGLAIGTLVVILFTFELKWKRVCLVGVAFALLVAAPMLSGSLVEFKREYSAVETRQSTEMRSVFAVVSWEMFKDQPLTGHGFGQFPIKNLPYLNDRSYGFSLQTIRGYIHHNTFLSILVELGLVGFVLYLWMLAAWAYAARKVWRDDQQPEWARGFGLFFLVLWVTAATQGFFHEVSISPLENGILFLAAGMTMALRNIQPQCSAIGRHPLESGYQTPTTGWMTGRGMAT